MPEFRGSDWYGATVVQITNLTNHPDADTLDITRVFAVDGDPNSGIPVIVKRGEFKIGDTAIYTGIDSIVPTHLPLERLAAVGVMSSEPGGGMDTRFAFLDPRGKPAKIKARRLRGVFSEGLLTPARVLNAHEFKVFRDETWLQPGCDLTIQLGITKFLPEAEQEPAMFTVLVTSGPVEDLTTGGTVDADTGPALLDWLVATLLKPGACPGWNWMTRDLIERAIRKGQCKVKLAQPLTLGETLFEAGTEITVRKPTFVAGVGDEITMMVSPGAIVAKSGGGGRPGVSFTMSQSENCPLGHLVPHYDLDALRKWGSGVLEEGEAVVAREKLHGANARTFHDGTRLWVGSRTQWKKRPTKTCDQCGGASICEVCLRCNATGLIYDHDGDLWWKAANKYDLERKLAAYPGLVLFYEVFGQVQDLRYGSQPGEVFIAVFDALVTNSPIVLNNGATGFYQEPGWYDDNDLFDLCQRLDLPMAPLVYKGPWSVESVLPLRNGPSMWPGADHCREGIVVRPLKERRHDRLGRVVLKVVGEDYKLRK